MSECICLNKNGEKCKRVCDTGVCWQHKAPLLLGSKLIHKTSLDGMHRIVESGVLLDSGELIKRQIFTPGGEGNISKRKCCDPRSYSNQRDIPSWCLEACATYFRLVLKDKKIRKPPKGRCLLQFSTRILCNEDVDWHFNTMENNGFLISDGSAFYGIDSDIPSRTVRKNDINTLEVNDFRKELEGGELVILQSVPTTYLLAVYFGDKDDFDRNKDFLSQNDIVPILL
jgi:hypothetical protein